MNTKDNKKENAAVFSVKSILEKTTKQLKTSAGRNESIYKKEVYNDIPKEKHKNLRTKLRKITENFAKTIVAEKDKNKLQSLIKDFTEYYISIYLVNDFTVNSICSNNTETETKELYLRMFDKINANIEKENNKKK